MDKETLINQLRGNLIVSCQSFEGEPIHGEGIMLKMAECALWAGAVGLRANHPKNVAEMKAATGLPVIGIWKVVTPGNDVYITPTMREVDALVEAGSDIIALDATDRLAANGEKAYALITKIKEKYPDQLIMADCSTFEEGANAIKLGADFVGTTLCGYTSYSEKSEGPSFGLIAKLCEAFPDRVIAEGKINTVEEARKCVDLGSLCVVVGGAITRPHLTARRFVEALKGK